MAKSKTETKTYYSLTDEEVAEQRSKEPQPGDVVWYIPPGQFTMNDVFLVVVTSLESSRDDCLMCVNMEKGGPAIAYRKSRLK